MKEVIITSEIKKAQDFFKKLTGEDLSDDRAFSHVLLKYIFNTDYEYQKGMVTDGSNDGGIDFVYFDEDESKVILGQSKYTTALTFESTMTELNKMSSTLANFYISNTSIYNDKLKVALQNALDSLPEDGTGNVEYNLFTTADIAIDSIMKKIASTAEAFSADSVLLYDANIIEKKILDVQESIDTVSAAKVELDHAGNVLTYENNDTEGIMVNVKSSSIVSLYNSWAGKGLFDLNIRKYIKSNVVDNGIKKTLDYNRDTFWFLNNGIIIACDSYEIDGNVIKLYDFSIVNGGQTTTLISTYNSKNSKEFYIPCKIIAKKSNNKSENFFTELAEASNSQKPIKARDLKSNAPEMIRLKKWLADNNIALDIKRGDKPSKKLGVSIKNDELGQLLLSMVQQKPGTARSNKKSIFENNDIYRKIYAVNYDRDENKKQFLLDLIDLYDRYNQIEKKLNSSAILKEQANEVLKNGKCMIFAMFGALYSLVNGDISENDFTTNAANSIKSLNFTYGPFLSNYKADDLDAKIETIIKTIVNVVADIYSIAYKHEDVTSVSNFFKTDLKYKESILAPFAETYYNMMVMDELKNSIDIFKR